jgi:hypothetical protein
MAAGTEERLKILQMVEEGKISAEEATALLRAMDSGRQASPSPSVDKTPKRFLRISVTDLATGNAKVNVTLPMGLVSSGLRMAERFAPESGIDMLELEELLAGGAMGKLVEVVDTDDNERVEIYVE